MARHTPEELRVWLAWLDLQWERPGPVEAYLMQVALEVCRGRLADPGRVKLDDFRLRLAKSGEGRPVSREQAAAWSRAAWLQRLGIKLEK